MSDRTKYKDFRKYLLSLSIFLLAISTFTALAWGSVYLWLYFQDYSPLLSIFASVLVLVFLHQLPYVAEQIFVNRYVTDAMVQADLAYQNHFKQRLKELFWPFFAVFWIVLCAGAGFNLAEGLYQQALYSAGAIAGASTWPSLFKQWCAES
jgi:hypothetical protein